MIPFSRADRVSGLIQEILSELLKKNIRDPRLAMVTISSVKMSRDLKLARIYFKKNPVSLNGRSALLSLRLFYELRESLPARHQYSDLSA